MHGYFHLQRFFSSCLLYLLCIFCLIKCVLLLTYFFIFCLVCIPVLFFLLYTPFYARLLNCDCDSLPRIWGADERWLIWSMELSVFQQIKSNPFNADVPGTGLALRRRWSCVLQRWNPNHIVLAIDFDTCLPRFCLDRFRHASAFCLLILLCISQIVGVKRMQM